MGYYTHHSLTIMDKESKEFDIDEVPNLKQILQLEIPGYEGNPFEEKCKWYDHDKDMMKVSSHFPELIFKLHGEGEESGDIWNTLYVNGNKLACKTEIVTEMPPMEEVLALMGEPKKIEPTEFKVKVRKVTSGTATITVKAISREEAGELAVTLAGGRDFEEENSEYKVLD